MFPPPTFYILLNLCWTYALLRGGRPERIGATVMVVGAALTILASPGPGESFDSVAVGSLLVDLGVFVAFAILALRTDRFWPIWASALVGVDVLGHVGRWYLGSDFSPGAYIISLAIWSYPILAVIAVGTWNHRRRLARLATGVAPSKARA